MRVVNQNRRNDFFQDDKLPTLLYSGNVANNPKWFYPQHSHSFCEIIYIFAGSGHFNIDGIDYTVTAGDLMIYNKNVQHEEKSSEDDPLVLYFLGVDDVWIKDLPKNFVISPELSPIIHLGSYKNKIENYINDIIFESLSQLEGCNITLQGLLTALIVSINRIIKTQNQPQKLSKGSNFSGRIKAYLDKNYASDLTLSTIAQNLYISPTYLSHKFKEETGTSPINYLIQKRIDEAKYLLLYSDMSIKNICEKIGYDNTIYFSKLFKKITGHPPAQFRKLFK